MWNGWEFFFLCMPPVLKGARAVGVSALRPCCSQTLAQRMLFVELNCLFAYPNDVWYSLEISAYGLRRQI